MAVPTRVVFRRSCVPQRTWHVAQRRLPRWSSDASAVQNSDIASARVPATNGTMVDKNPPAADLRRTVSSPTAPAKIDELSLYSIYLDYIRHENELINHRNTWFLAAQGFLLAGAGFVLQKGFVAVAETWGTPTLTGIFDAIKYLVMWFICCWSGIITSQQALRSISGARRSQEEIEMLWLAVSSQPVRAVLPDLRGGKNAPATNAKGHGIGRGLSTYTLRLWWAGGGAAALFCMAVIVRAIIR